MAAVTNIKRVYLKLGVDCNLHCKYCHAERVPFRFNPAILPVLKSFGLDRLNFGGGEPLLYWEVMEQIITYLGNGLKYRFVTNGTLFTREIVEFCNKNHIFVYISMDGINTTRDMSEPIRWDLIRQLWFCGIGTTFYRENQNIRETLESLNTIKKRYLSISPDIYSSFPNFVHSTSKTGVLSDRALADSYVVQMTEIAEEAIKLFKEGYPSLFLEMLYSRFVRKKRIVGINCCNDRFITMLSDGSICSCPYTFDKIGDIFHIDEIDWFAVKEKYSRPQCSSCDLFNVCGNECCANVTDDECYIMRRLHKSVVEIMDKYDVTTVDLETVYLKDRTNHWNKFSKSII